MGIYDTMMFIMRIWRNGSVLDEQIVCPYCKAALADYPERLCPGDEQTFTEIMTTAECEHDGHDEVLLDVEALLDQA